MADFFKFCFPSARKRPEDDSIKLVSAAALPGSRHSRHNDHLRHNIARPKPQPESVVPPKHTSPSSPYPQGRRPLEDLQDVIDDEAQHDETNQDIVFSMSDRAYAQVLRDLGSALHHSRWAIGGSFAEALWACPRGKRRDIISIFCQRSSRSVTKIWLTSQSLFSVSPSDENVLQYQGDLMGAAPISVRLRWVSDREFERLQAVESHFSYRMNPFEPVRKVPLVILTLPALADNLAWSWVNASKPQARDDFAEDLFSVLKRIVDLEFSVGGSGPLTVRDNVHMMSEAFWTPFTKTYPQATALLAQCGLPIPSFGVVSFSSQPVLCESSMQMAPAALQFESFQKPRVAPLPPPAPHKARRSPTNPSRISNSSTPPSSLLSTHREQSSSSKGNVPYTKPKSKRQQHLSKGENHLDLKLQSFDRKSTRPVSSRASPKRPVHPANIIHSEPEPRFSLSVLFGLKESPETVARRHQEKLENDRAARRASEKLGAKIQRNREREREREWHTRKQAERMSRDERDSEESGMKP